MSGRPRTTTAAIATAVLILAACGTAKTAMPSVSRSTVPITIATPTVPAPKPTALPTTTITSSPKPKAWPMRSIASTGQAQDIAPTSSYVYWLSQPGALSTNGATVTVYQYNPLSGQVRKGPSFNGFIGSPALTDTGGWVWMVVGTGNDVVVEQLVPSTLAVHSTESLLVKDNLDEPQINPVLTATVDGPLWIAGGEDLWALNPSNGAVETEFDTGNLLLSMSTDPTGTLLYTGAEIGAEGGMSVTEYDAQTGQEIQRSDMPQYLALAISQEPVAATNSGVWISVRYGMAGPAFELSAHGLTMIAPPPSKGGAFGTYDQIMGIGSSVSAGTLWLTSNAETATLTCADPTSGAIRASESTSVTVEAPIASGSLLYAVASGGVVVITPPEKCFG